MSSLFGGGGGPLSPTNPAVRRLVALAREAGGASDGDGDDKWAEKAVRSLAKKLRRSALLDVLEQALVDADSTSPCVPIPRSLDGRLQVSQRKCIPHLTYCRLWRWPDLPSQHHLKAAPHCQHPYTKKVEQAQVCVNPYHYERVEPSPLPPVLVPRAPLESRVSPGAKAAAGGDEQRPNAKQTTVCARIEVTELSAASVAAAAFASTSCDDKHTDLLDHINCNEMAPLELDGLDLEDYLSEDADSTVDQSSPRSATSAPLPSGHSSPDLVAIDAVPVDYKEPEHWCTVTYYEFKERVGEPFRATTSDFLVDGYCDPSSNERFCLGNLSNVSRQRVTAEVRKRIGAGVRVYRTGPEVYAECLCDAALFVQSTDTNRRFSLNADQTLKVMPGCNLKIFDHIEFYRTLRRSVAQGPDSVKCLTRMCTVRLSFIKGWGAEYRRQAVMELPCWLELHMNGALQWLDRVLMQMPSPELRCSSDT